MGIEKEIRNTKRVARTKYYTTSRLTHDFTVYHELQDDLQSHKYTLSKQPHLNVTFIDSYGFTTTSTASVVGTTPHTSQPAHS